MDIIPILFICLPNVASYAALDCVADSTAKAVYVCASELTEHEACKIEHPGGDLTLTVNATNGRFIFNGCAQTDFDSFVCVDPTVFHNSFEGEQ